MSKKKRAKRPIEPLQRRSTITLVNSEAWESLICAGYTPLSQVPEVQAVVEKMASMIASMTIHLVSNSKSGDIRIKNQLSRFLDIEPNPYLTRQKLMFWLVHTLLLEGDGNAVLSPRTRDGLLYSLDPIAPDRVTFMQSPGGYQIYIDGIPRDPEQLLHFAVNPQGSEWWKGRGYRVALRTVADNLMQASKTTHEFMESKYQPPLIVKVDALIDEFATKEGRQKLLDEYIHTSRRGEPWVIPSEAMDVQSVKPLSLNDLAISSTVTLSKKAVASIFGAPAFILGEGAFNSAEWNNFVDSTIMAIAIGIQQELTRKLILSPDWYVKFNARSLHAYDISQLATIGDNQYTRGIMTGNEVRDWLNLDPIDGLDELVILENYIPAGMIGDQNKLSGGDDNET